jgi:hypothetical protein
VQRAPAFLSHLPRLLDNEWVILEHGGGLALALAHRTQTPAFCGLRLRVVCICVSLLLWRHHYIPNRAFARWLDETRHTLPLLRPYLSASWLQRHTRRAGWLAGWLAGCLNGAEGTVSRLDCASWWQAPACPVVCLLQYNKLFVPHPAGCRMPCSIGDGGAGISYHSFLPSSRYARRSTHGLFASLSPVQPSPAQPTPAHSSLAQAKPSSHC